VGFKSFMEHVGHDLKNGLDFILPWAAGAGEVAVGIFAPGLGPMFNATVAAVVLAEQKANALGKAQAGPQKLADVLGLMEPVISQGLKDAGQDGSTSSVMGYINGVVKILNAAPPPKLPPPGAIA
jgi:hypothetical protein